MFLSEGLVAFLEEKLVANLQYSRALGVDGGLRGFGRRVNHGPPRSALGFVFLDEKT